MNALRNKYTSHVRCTGQYIQVLYQGSSSVGQLKRISSKPKLFWVTSRQAPNTIWVDKATERAIYAFGQRDTSGYPHQSYLDHGDLVDAYGTHYANKTMPVECIGKKGVGGDYFPTEQCIADIFEYVRSGVLTTHHCMHDL